MQNSHPSRKLRGHPDVAQLKRQAKELLEAFRCGDASACKEVNAHFRNADASTFALHDSQLVLARLHGFDSWSKLKAFVEGVTIKRLADAVRQGDENRVSAMLKVRPELVHKTLAADNEHRAIHYAVLARHAGMVRLLMQHGSDARIGIYPHREATTAMQLATERGYDDMVEIILHEEQRRQGEADAPVSQADELTKAMLSDDDDKALGMLADEPGLIHARNRGGWTALHVAAALRKVPIVTWLLKHDADVHRRGPGDVTPLDAVVGRAASATDAFEEIVQLLRKHGAKITARAAVATGDLDWLQARHSDGSLTNPIEDAGGLLTIAVRYDKPEVLKALIDFGFDPDERMRLKELDEAQYSAGMPLWNCARLGRYSMAEQLLESGADPNAHVYASGSPVYSAYRAGDARMVELLTLHGGVVDPITVALFHETGIAKQMLASGAHDAAPHEHYAGETVAEHLLWGAVCSGDVEIVRAALEFVDWPDEDVHWYEMLDQPLRSWSRTAGEFDSYVECFRLVLRRCDPNIPHPRIGRTLLHDVAAIRPSVPDETVVAFATQLLDAGARMDVRDEVLKSTPLGWACRWGRGSMVKLLLARGADPIEADAEPWAAPRSWAAKRSGPEIANILSGMFNYADGQVHE